MYVLLSTSTVCTCLYECVNKKIPGDAKVTVLQPQTIGLPSLKKQGHSLSVKIVSNVVKKLLIKPLILSCY